MRDIKEFREKLLGAKVVDIDEVQKVIYLEDETKRVYAVNHTNEGLMVNRFPTKEEEFIELKVLVNLLLQKLDIDEDELWDLYC
ncbi:MAG TPA: hypothetical protein VK071_06975 [Tissierellales bacterium]|nr:hypothetical protein [Tissierellales bacterium]